MIICDNVCLALLMEYHTILFNLLHFFKRKMKQDVTDIVWINRKMNIVVKTAQLSVDSCVSTYLYLISCLSKNFLSIWVVVL
jgi:hypothetical protein